VSEALDSHEKGNIAEKKAREGYELAQSLSRRMDSDIFAGFSCSCEKTHKSRDGWNRLEHKAFLHLTRRE
jgi:hypothetical protein